MIIHHSLTTTSACKISDEMFFNNIINITFKWCINYFFLETLLLFFFVRLFSLPTWFLSLSFGFWIFWQLSSCFQVSSCILFLNSLLWRLVTVCKVTFTLWKHWYEEQKKEYRDNLRMGNKPINECNRHINLKIKLINLEIIG